jgi:hypothetical protein
VQLLILDDWLRDPLTPSQARDLLDLLDDRFGRVSTMTATQLPLDLWHAQLPDPAVAGAVLDRLIHNAYRLQLKGESQPNHARHWPNRPPDANLNRPASLRSDPRPNSSERVAEFVGIRIVGYDSGCGGKETNELGCQPVVPSETYPVHIQPAGGSGSRQTSARPCALTRDLTHRERVE